METNVNNPLVVRCDYCGGDVSFDIEKQKYCCTHCGAEMGMAEHKTQYAHWKNLRSETVMRESKGVKSFECPACGAKTLVAGDNATALCPFCQNTMIDAQFAGNDIPEVIIPFKLSKEEAEGKLREWLNANKSNPAAKVINQNMMHFTGCYLPYHIVRGTYNSALQIRAFGGSSTDYPFRAYLKHTAVNASSDLSNIFLDGIEPFDFDQAFEFNFGYLNHQEAKVQNVWGDSLKDRIIEETREELYQTLSKKVRTKEMEVGMNDDENESIAALLPVYLVKCGDVAAAVNGQTGKVSIDTGKRKNHTRNWWMAPTLATLTVSVVAAILAHDAAYGLIPAFVFGIVFFVFAYSRHGNELAQNIITWPKTKKEHNDVQLEFVNDFGDGLVPVKIKFFSPWRIIKLVLATLAVIFLPVLLAIPIQLFRGLPLSTIQIGYGAAWYCIPGFFTIIAAAGAAKSMMYGAPEYYEILPNGKTKHRKKNGNKGKSSSLLSANPLKMFFGNKAEQSPTEGLSRKNVKPQYDTWKEDRKQAWGIGCLVVGFLIFLLFGSLLAMIS